MYCLVHSAHRSCDIKNTITQLTVTMILCRYCTSPSMPLVSALDFQLRRSVQGPSIEMNRPTLSSDELPWNARNASVVKQKCGASH
jgi:hypothetical protein